MAPLATGEWFSQGLKLCLTDPPSAARHYGPASLATRPRRHYLRVSRLFEQLRIAQGDGSGACLMGQLQKTDLPILDSDRQPAAHRALA